MAVKKEMQKSELVAIISLVILLLSIVKQIDSICRTKYVLNSPLVSQNIVEEINKQFIFHAFISAIASIIGFILFSYKKYLWVIILVVLTLVSERYIYIF